MTDAIDKPSGEGEGAYQTVPVYETVESAERRDKSNDVRAAFISGGVAMFVGLATLLASYWSTSRQIDSAADQAQDEFVRERRQDVYTQVLADGQQVLDQITLVTASATGASPDNHVRFDQRVEEWVAVSGSAEVNLISSQIVGSEGIVRAAERIHAAMDDMHEEIIVIQLFLEEGGTMAENGAAMTTFRSDVLGAQQDFREAHKAFIVAARNDQLGEDGDDVLGSPDITGS